MCSSSLVSYMQRCCIYHSAAKWLLFEGKKHQTASWDQAQHLKVAFLLQTEVWEPKIEALWQSYAHSNGIVQVLDPTALQKVTSASFKAT